MNAIFHIGHHKTGTTSLQAFLAVNAHQLLKAGILVPWVEPQGAVLAQTQATEADDFDPTFLPLNVREPHNAMAFKMVAEGKPDGRVPKYHPNLPASADMLHAIATQVEFLDPAHVVLCSEVMGWLASKAPDQISNLAEALDGADFRLHVTLRRPDLHLVSWHGQSLKFGQSSAPPRNVAESGGLSEIHVDYRSMIEPWLDRLPDATHCLRNHADTMAAGGSIPDFFAQSGLEIPDGLTDVPRLNPSLPRALHGLQRAVNKALPRPAARNFARELDTLTDGLDMPDNNAVECFGPTARAALADHFAPIHTWLSDLAGAPAFFPDIDEMRAPLALPEDDALRQVLDQITDDRIAALPGPRMRTFLTEFRDTFHPEPFV